MLNAWPLSLHVDRCSRMNDHALPTVAGVHAGIRQGQSPVIDSSAPPSTTNSVDQVAEMAWADNHMPTDDLCANGITVQH